MNIIKMFMSGVLVVILFSYLMIWLVSSSAEAMSKCQERHSYDTCFHTLNN